MCNGHADTCDNTDPRDPYKLVCRCQHNTCGDQCQTCCRGFQQKAWKQSKANSLFVCERKFKIVTPFLNIQFLYVYLTFFTLFFSW